MVITCNKRRNWRGIFKQRCATSQLKRQGQHVKSGGCLPQGPLERNSLISIFNSYHLPRNKITLSQTNIAPEHVPSEKEISSCNHPFSGAKVFVSRRLTKTRYPKSTDLDSFLPPHLCEIKNHSIHLQVSMNFEGSYWLRFKRTKSHPKTSSLSILFLVEVDISWLVTWYHQTNITSKHKKS